MVSILFFPKTMNCNRCGKEVVGATRRKKCDQCGSMCCNDCIRGYGWTDQGGGGALWDMCYDCNNDGYYKKKILEKIQSIQNTLETTSQHDAAISQAIDKVKDLKDYVDVYYPSDEE